MRRLADAVTRSLSPGPATHSRSSSREKQRNGANRSNISKSKNLGGDVIDPASSQFSTKNSDPLEKILDVQYELAKAYYIHGTKQAQATQKMAENSVLLSERGAHISLAKSLVSATKDFAPLPDDWVECYDVKSKRKYFYSKARKQSAWRIPKDAPSSYSTSSSTSPSPSPLPAHAQTSRRLNDVSRSSTPTPSLREVSPARSEVTGRYAPIPARSSSPLVGKVLDLFGRVPRNPPSAIPSVNPITAMRFNEDDEEHDFRGSRSVDGRSSISSTISQSSSRRLDYKTPSQARVKSSSTSSASAMSPSPWREAVDPKRNRMYYYNKITQERTWTRPTDM